MRALASAITLFLVTTPALAASPQAEAAVKVFQAVGADANRLKTFCEMMQIDKKNARRKPRPLSPRWTNCLISLGRISRPPGTLPKVSTNSPDGKVLNAALDQLEDKCPD